MRIVPILVALVGCAKSAPATTPSAVDKPDAKPDVMQQVWTVGGEPLPDGTCMATPNCEIATPGVACTTPPIVGIAQFSPTDCLAGAKAWTIGQRASDTACMLIEATCSAGGTGCVPASRTVACPAPLAVATEEPANVPPQVEYSVSAERNLERGRIAMKAGRRDDARKYFVFLIDRFPYSKFRADAEAELRDLDKQ